MTDENGLVYMRARYYSPTFKRFINADVVAGSITNAITLNRYAYANGNPVSNIDPFGLSSQQTCREGSGNNSSFHYVSGVDSIGSNSKGVMFKDRYTDLDMYYEWISMKPDHWDDFFDQSKQLWEDTYNRIKRVISIKRSISTMSEEVYPFDILGKYMPIILESTVEHKVESENDSFATINIDIDGKTGWLSGVGLTADFGLAAIDLNLSPDDTGIGLTLDVSENVSQSYALFANINELKVGFSSTTTMKSADVDNSYISSSSSLSLNMVWWLALAMGDQAIRYISENGLGLPQLPIPQPLAG